MSKRVVIYTSPTCGPCKTLKPELFGLSLVRGFEVVAVEASFETQEQFVAAGVRTVPTVVLMYGDKEAGRFVGSKTPAELEAQIKDWGL